MSEENERCSRCEGSGYVTYEWTECKWCDGTGYRLAELENMNIKLGEINTKLLRRNVQLQRFYDTFSKLVEIGRELDGK